MSYKQINNSKSENSGREHGQYRKHENGYESEEYEDDVDRNTSNNTKMPSDLHQSPVNPNIDTHSQTPLLHTGNGTPNGNGQQTRLSYDSPRMRPTLPKKHSTFREQDPSSTDAAAATKKRYTYAAVFLGISLVTFAVQTETAYYIQHALGWKKPYCML